MAKRALSGVDEVTRTAMDKSKGALDRRVPVRGGRNEIDRLAETFNSMVDRVLVLTHGGTIAATSARGAGARFTVILPA